MCHVIEAGKVDRGGSTLAKEKDRETGTQAVEGKWGERIEEEGRKWLGRATENGVGGCSGFSCTMYIYMCVCTSTCSNSTSKRRTLDAGRAQRPGTRALCGMKSIIHLHSKFSLSLSEDLGMFHVPMAREQYHRACWHVSYMYVATGSII